MAVKAVRLMALLALMTTFGGMTVTAATVANDEVPDDSIRLTTLGTRDGLSQTSVPAIGQDSYGFMWLGTSDGLNRYDGHRLRSWRRGKQGLARDSVQSLCVDTHDGLWIGLFDGGVHRYDTRHNQLGPHLQDQGGPNGPLPGRVSGCLAEPSGAVWFATDTGLSRYDHNAQHFVHWPLAAPTDTESSQRLLALQRDPRGRLWVLGSQAIHLFDNGLQQQTLPAALAARTRFTSFWVDDDSLLIGTSSAGLWRWQFADNSLTAVTLPRMSSLPIITTLLRDRSGRLWVGTETQGVLFQTGNGQPWQRLRQQPGQPDSLPDNHVRSLFQSREGVIWIGTWLGGVSRLDPLQTSFHTMRTDPTRADSLPVSSVRSILAEADTLWIGTDGGGLARSRDGGYRFETFRHQPGVPSLSDDHVRFIHRDRAKQLWIGTENGLNRWRGNRIEPVSLPLPAGANDSSLQMRAVLEDPSNGSLWLGTFGGGLLNYFPAQHQLLRLTASGTADDDLCGNRVVALRFDLDGSLLVGADDGGLCRRLGDGRFERLLPRSFSVWSLFVDDDAIWIGSYGDGLLKYHRRSQRIHRFGASHGISNDVIYAIQPDIQGQLWLSSNDGLFRFDPTRERADAFPVSAGLQDREFNSGASARGPNGHLYFGGIRGLNWFDPAAVALNTLPPVSTISQIDVMQREFNQPAHASTTLNLPANQNTLALSFAAQHFSSPEGNRYRYRLLPIEADWNELSNGAHQVQYNQLPTGSYQFELRAGSAAGVWDPNIRQLAIEIGPLPWQSPLAYTIYALLTALLLMALWLQHRRNRQQEQAMLSNLKQQVEQRTHELQEKNHALETVNTELQQANLRLDSISLSDPLTGLGNRRMLFRYLEKDAPTILRRHQDAASQLQALHQADMLFFLIDLDHFKRINDSFGHAIGDEVLLGVRDRLQHICREQDYLVRYGGEEFLLVSRFSERGMSPQIAERIRSVVGDQPFTLSNGAKLTVTCSIGYAAYPLKPDSIDAYSCEQVLQIADCLLYAAKHSGRNQWVGAVSVREAKAEALLHRLRDNGALAVSSGDIELQSSQRSVKRLRWRAPEADRFSDLAT